MQFGAHIFGVGALAEPATLVLDHIATHVIQPYQRGA